MISHRFSMFFFFLCHVKGILKYLVIAPSLVLLTKAHELGQERDTWSFKPFSRTIETIWSRNTGPCHHVATRAMECFEFMGFYWWLLMSIWSNHSICNIITWLYLAAVLLSLQFQRHLSFHSFHAGISWPTNGTAANRAPQLSRYSICWTQGSHQCRLQVWDKVCSHQLIASTAEPCGLKNELWVVTSSTQRMDADGCCGCKWWITGSM